MAALRTTQLIGVIESFFAQGYNGGREALSHLLQSKQLRNAQDRPIRQYYRLYAAYDQLYKSYMQDSGRLIDWKYAKRRENKNLAEAIKQGDADAQKKARQELGQIEGDIRALDEELHAKYDSQLKSLQKSFRRVFASWEKQASDSDPLTLTQCRRYLRAHYQSLSTVNDKGQLTLQALEDKAENGLSELEALAEEGFAPAQHRIAEANLRSASVGAASAHEGVVDDVTEQYVASARAGYQPSQLQVATAYIQHVQSAGKELPPALEGVTEKQALGWLQQGLEHFHVSALITTQRLIEDFIKKSSVLRNEVLTESDQRDRAHVEELSRIVMTLVKDDPALSSYLQKLSNPDPAMSSKDFKALQKESEKAMNTYIDSKVPSKETVDTYLQEKAQETIASYEKLDKAKLQEMLRGLKAQIKTEMERYDNLISNEVEDRRYIILRRASLAVEVQLLDLKLGHSLEPVKSATINILRHLKNDLRGTGINNIFKDFINTCCEKLKIPPLFKTTADRFLGGYKPLLTAYEVQTEQSASLGGKVKAVASKSPAPSSQEPKKDNRLSV